VTIRKSPLDEDLPHKLRPHLPGEVFTVAFMGWGGLKNGELLKAAEEAGFDVIVTGDQGMPYEPNNKAVARKIGAHLTLVGLDVWFDGFIAETSGSRDHVSRQA
jgi:hypothetical protein